MAALARGHAGQEGAGEMHRRFQVDVDHGVDLGRVDVLKQRAGGEDAGIVDEDVQLDPGQRLFDRGHVAHVGLDGDGPGLTRKFGERVPVAADGVDGEAARAQARHSGLADAAGRAGDERGAIGFRHRYSLR